MNGIPNRQNGGPGFGATTRVVSQAKEVKYSPSLVLRQMSPRKRGMRVMGQGKGMGVFLSSFFDRLYKTLMASAEEDALEIRDPGTAKNSSVSPQQTRNLLPAAAKPQTFLLSLVLHQRAQCEIGQFA
ncbi:hypothetical protein HOP50_17g79520 [Chloropicon primus]|nr:hypothetical protein A3770_17p79290 [Chloropicon primus]UPR04608.1 hypothetical protein HOP50_17g79520 [Chloropicon primus]|eukprot:QDZ25411.1 hypothetical protein A3770_17p79290 [Chloropicon primus]